MRFKMPMGPGGHCDEYAPAGKQYHPIILALETSRWKNTSSCLGPEECSRPGSGKKAGSPSMDAFCGYQGYSRYVEAASSDRASGNYWD